MATLFVYLLTGPLAMTILVMASLATSVNSGKRFGPSSMVLTVNHAPRVRVALCRQFAGDRGLRERAGRYLPTPSKRHRTLSEDRRKT